MRKLSLLIVALAIACLPVVAQDLNIIGAGARSHGMGGAFIGVADDATALSWNPAGIAQLDRVEASAVGLFNMKKFTDKRTWHSGTWDSSATTETNVNHIAPNFFSLVLPFKMAERNLVFAVAYQRLVDFGEGLDSSHVYPTYTLDYKEKQTGGIDAITPALGVQITPNFMVGAAANIIVNGSTIKVDREYSNGFYYHYKENMKFSGLNFNAGVLALVTKKLNVGASLRLPFTLTRKGDGHTESNYATSGDTTYPERSWTMPFMIGAGIALKPTENLTLALDYERRNYHSTEFTYKHYRNGSLVDTTIETGWSNVNQFRVGMEYLFIGQKAVFPVRLGFRTSPLTEPAQKWTESATGTWSADSTTITQYVATAGFGMKLGKLWFDLAYELTFGDNYKYEENYSTAGDIYKHTTAEISHNILASMIFHF